MPLFLTMSVGLFTRAHYLLWMKRHGSSRARVLTVVLTLVAAAVWAMRLSSDVAAFVLG